VGSTTGGGAACPAGPRLRLPIRWDGSVRRAIQSSATAASTLPSGRTGIPAWHICVTRALLIFNRRAKSALLMVSMITPMPLLSVKRRTVNLKIPLYLVPLGDLSTGKKPIASQYLRFGLGGHHAIPAG
jgi:hypothetical protein